MDFLLFLGIGVPFRVVHATAESSCASKSRGGGGGISCEDNFGGGGIMYEDDFDFFGDASFKISL